MEMADNVHFADVFDASGPLKTYSMGKKKDGKWRVENDERCVDRGKDDGGCYQVWISGKNVEFGHEGLAASLDGSCSVRPPATDPDRPMRPGSYEHRSYSKTCDGGMRVARGIDRSSDGNLQEALRLGNSCPTGRNGTDRRSSLA
jgi:hypothetical protein